MIQKGNNGSPKVDDQLDYKSDERKTEHPEKKLNGQQHKGGG